MKDTRKKKSSPKPPEKQAPAVQKAAALPLRTASSVVRVTHLDVPPTITRPNRIHPRRLLPFVREGQERSFHSLDTRAIIHHAEAAGRDIVIVRNTSLTQPAANRTASNVGEPSLSINGDVVFYTGNWYASVSTDGGKTFKFIDPNGMAQPNDPAGVTFCCDQIVNYMPTIDTFVWLLQYGPEAGNNIQRLAFAKTTDVKAGKWRIFDITTQVLGVAGFFLDFPDLAVGANFLYATTNCFSPDGKTVGSAVVRIPLSSIAQGNPRAEEFVSMDLFAFRVAQNCADTAYFAAHRDTSTLAVFSWPESQAAPTPQDVPVARWIGTNGYISRTPDGRRWLDRADPRITGATLAGDELWFAWGVDADSNHRPKPFVQMARLDRNSMSVIENVNLFDTDSAICYAGLATNANNEVGISYMIGGAVFPSHVVGILTNDRKSLVAANGDRGPLADAQGHFEWGDYLTARPVYPDRKLFAAGGYTLLGQQDGGDVDATPRFVIFGRAADTDQPAVAPVSETQPAQPRQRRGRRSHHGCEQARHRKLRGGSADQSCLRSACWCARNDAAAHPAAGNGHRAGRRALAGEDRAGSRSQSGGEERPQRQEPGRGHCAGHRGRDDQHASPARIGGHQGRSAGVPAQALGDSRGHHLEIGCDYHRPQVGGRRRLSPGARGRQRRHHGGRNPYRDHELRGRFSVAAKHRGGAPGGGRQAGAQPQSEGLCPAAGRHQPGAARLAFRRSARPRDGFQAAGILPHAGGRTGSADAGVQDQGTRLRRRG